MLNFYDEMIFRLHLPPEETVGYRVTLFAGRAVVVEGHKGLTSVGEAEVVLRISRAKLRITGRNLSISEMNGDEAYITGKIIAVEVDDG